MALRTQAEKYQVTSNASQAKEAEESSEILAAERDFAAFGLQIRDLESHKLLADTRTALHHTRSRTTYTRTISAYAHFTVVYL